jgi:excisionase family DNA binding protein
MKKSTSQIIRVVLSADETVGPHQIDAVLSILTERPPRNPDNRPLPLLMTQAEVARMLNVSRFAIHRMVKDGELHAVSIRGAMRYRREEVIRLAMG